MTSKLFIAVVTAFGLVGARYAENPFLGRWDITVHAFRGDYPSWLEVTETDGKLGGRFCGRTGSASPLREPKIEGDKLIFGQNGNYEARRVGDRLEGITRDRQGSETKWSAVPVPELKRTKLPKWDKPVELFNGTDLSGWHAKSGGQHGWVVEDGVLVNKKPGEDLVSDRKFMDFKVHAEFRLPKGSNSGLYLRGRYEAQIDDDYGKPANSHGMGGIYGLVTPKSNPSKPAGEWQTYDIVLVGRMVTISLNGEKVVDNEEIAGVTGGALDSNEGSPGPIMIQGDHGTVEFRKVTVTPAK